MRGEESRYRELPCAAPSCHEPRVRVGSSKHARFSHFCAAHHAVARQRRTEEVTERALTECSLAHLWQRWERFPLLPREARIDGVRVCGMEPVGSAHAYRVTLAGGKVAYLDGDVQVTLHRAEGETTWATEL